MTDKKRKWRTPKQWYDEEYRPKNHWDYSYRKGANEGFALLLLGSSFVFRYWAVDRWTWPTFTDVLISIPFMLIGAAILLRYRSGAFKRKEARQWGWHDTEINQVESTGGIHFQPTCACGWTGSVQNAEIDAEVEAARHMVHEDRLRENSSSEGQS